MADGIFYTLYFFLYFLIPTVLFHSFNKLTKKQNHLHLPPSPPALPVIGHLHHLSPTICKSFQNLSTKYGPLLYLRLGAIRCILVSSASIASEIFKTQDITFSSRSGFAFEDELPYGSFGIAASPYGDYWKFMRKFMMTDLLAPRQLDRSRAVRHDEIEKFLRKMLESASKKEEVDMGAEFMKLTNNITCRIAMSTRCSEADDEAEKIRGLVREIFQKSVKVFFGDVFGWPLKRLAFWWYGREVVDVCLRFDELFEKILKEHEERGSREGLERENKDFIDILLTLCEDDEAQFKITRTHLKAFMLVSGSIFSSPMSHFHD